MESIIKRNYLEILKTFFIALVFLVIGSFLGVYFIPASLRNFLNIAFFVLVLISMFTRKGGFIRTKIGMNVYAFVLGILTGSTFIYYFYRLGSMTFISIVLGVVLIFGISYLVALNKNEEDIFKLSSFVTIGIIVLLVLELINIFFFKFSTIALITSGIGVAVYTIYSLIIMKSIQARCRYGVLSEEEIVNFSFSIFISFLNLLLDILRLVSIVSDDR